MMLSHRSLPTWEAYEKRMVKILQCAQQGVAELLVAESLHGHDAGPGFVAPRSDDVAEVLSDFLAFRDNLVDLKRAQVRLLVQILGRGEVAFGAVGLWR